jgi:hypothetical protein
MRTRHDPNTHRNELFAGSPLRDDLHEFAFVDDGVRVASGEAFGGPHRRRRREERAAVHGLIMMLLLT